MNSLPVEYNDRAIADLESIQDPLRPAALEHLTPIPT